MKKIPALLVFIFVLRITSSAAEFNAAAATNQVGLDLYRQLAAKDPAENLAISPYSIQSALALAYAGADGATRKEISKALRLPLEDAEVRGPIGALRNALAKISSDSVKLTTDRRREGGQVEPIIGGKRITSKTDPGPPIEWHEANRLFAQNGYAFREDFLTLMREGYAAPLELLDFRHDAEEGREVINRWVNETTAEKIQNLIPSGGVNRDTRLVLVNALYLKAAWDTPFEETLTRPESFHVSSGNPVPVPTMHRQGNLGYSREKGFTVVSLDYLGRQLRCLILLPDKSGSVAKVASSLAPADFARWANLGDKTRPMLVNLSLPRFRVDGTTLPLGPALRSLGMRSAFNDPLNSANFDRIAPRKPDDYLAIAEIFHRTFVDLDEQGTEAAAATTAVILSSFGVGGSPPKPIEIRVDRPFLFAIQHRESGVCLFLGRIADPR